MSDPGTDRSRVQDRQKCSAGKAQGTEGLLAAVRAELLGELPHAFTVDRSVLQVNKNKNPSLLAPVVCTKTSLLHVLCASASLQPCCCQQAPSSSTKPSGVTVKWHKNKTDRKAHFLKALVF